MQERKLIVRPGPKEPEEAVAVDDDVVDELDVALRKRVVELLRSTVETLRPAHKLGSSQERVQNLWLPTAKNQA